MPTNRLIAIRLRGQVSDLATATTQIGECFDLVEDSGTRPPRGGGDLYFRYLRVLVVDEAAPESAGRSAQLVPISITHNPGRAEGGPVTGEWALTRADLARVLELVEELAVRASAVESRPGRRRTRFDRT